MRRRLLQREPVIDNLANGTDIRFEPGQVFNHECGWSVGRTIAEPNLAGTQREAIIAQKNDPRYDDTLMDTNLWYNTGNIHGPNS